MSSGDPTLILLLAGQVLYLLSHPPRLLHLLYYSRKDLCGPVISGFEWENESARCGDPTNPAIHPAIYGSPAFSLKIHFLLRGALTQGIRA